METNEILKLQALKYKAEVMKDHPGLEQLDGEPDWMYEGLDTSGETRNICGMVPLSLFDEINRVSGILSISKRRVVEMALRDFAINATKALDEVGFKGASIEYVSMGQVPVDLE